MGILFNVQDRGIFDPKQKIIVLALRFSRFYRGYGRKKPAKREKVNQVAVNKAVIPHEFAGGSL